MADILDWRNILVATDFSPVGENAVGTAGTLASRGSSALSVVHVADSPSETPEARRSIQEIVTGLRRDVPGTRGFVRVGKPWREILRLGEELAADAIVLGSTGFSVVERLLGSTAENVVRHASSPVLIVRNEPLEAIRRVLLPVDMDEGSEASVRYALEKFGEKVELDGIHVVGFARMVEAEHADTLPPDSESARRLRAFLDELGAERISSRVVLGEPAGAILDAARDADLVVIATNGRKGLARALLGSVTEEVTRDCEKPVLVVPGPRATPRKKPSRAATLEGEVDP